MQAKITRQSSGIYRLCCLCLFDGDLDALILPDVNAESMSLFLQKISENHAHEHIVLLLMVDNQLMRVLKTLMENPKLVTCFVCLTGWPIDY
jgi:hypothetical protein